MNALFLAIITSICTVHGQSVSTSDEIIKSQEACFVRYITCYKNTGEVLEDDLILYCLNGERSSDK